MENQINIDDQNNQQIGQNPINQTPVSAEKTKVNYWMIIAIVLFVILIVTGVYAFSSKRQKIDNYGFSEPTPTSYTREIPTTTPSQEPTKAPTQTEAWQPYSFEVARDSSFEIKIPQSWKVERKARTIKPVTGEIEYWTQEEQLKKLEEEKFTETLNISKDKYILNIYFPGSFGMDFCFYPGAPAFPPYYNGESDYNFGTLKEFEKINSQYGNYLRGKTVLLVESGLHKNEFNEMFYVKTCEKETNTPNYHGSIKGGFFTYYYPTNNPQAEYIKIMDEILKSFHQK